MKIWVPKQLEVKVEVVTEPNEDLGLKPGDLQVTDADGKTRLYTPAEFEARFEEIEKNSWPGYLKRKAGESFMNGTAMVGFVGADMIDLINQMNAWAEKPENRHLILGDSGDHYWTGPDGRLYAVMYCYAATNKESHEHLAERAEVEKEVNEKWAEKKKQLGIDERNHLEKAKDLRAASEAIERTKRRELEELAAVGRACKNNHGKAMKGKEK